MPTLRRPDGVELHWEERGEGPLVVFANTFFNYPGLFAGLVEDLAHDHRVVEYDVRGTGGSSRTGPYDIDTDVEDLVALIEQLAPPATIVAFGDGCMRAVKAAAARPDLFHAVVSAAGAPIGRDHFRGDSGLMGSDEVVQGMEHMLRVDYRSAARSIISSVSSQATEEEIRTRVERTLEYSPQDVSIARTRDWMAADATAEARAIGRRLWIIESGTNPWFGTSITFERGDVLLPEANILPADDGPMSRPDIPARVVRRLTGKLR